MVGSNIRQAGPLHGHSQAVLTQRVADGKQGRAGVPRVHGSHDLPGRIVRACPNRPRLIDATEQEVRAKNRTNGGDTKIVSNRPGASHRCKLHSRPAGPAREPERTSSSWKYGQHTSRIRGTLDVVAGPSRRSGTVTQRHRHRSEACSCGPNTYPEVRSRLRTCCTSYRNGGATAAACVHNHHAAT